VVEYVIFVLCQWLQRGSDIIDGFFESLVKVQLLFFLFVITLLLYKILGGLQNLVPRCWRSLVGVGLWCTREFGDFFFLDLDLLQLNLNEVFIYLVCLFSGLLGWRRILSDVLGIGEQTYVRIQAFKSKLETLRFFDLKVLNKDRIPPKEE
jgi:hypothetical protein